ncbi:hypothetical protein JCM15579A_14150 [Marinifilum fragile]
MGSFKRYLDSLSCSIAFSDKEENNLPFIYFNPKSKRITNKKNNSYKLGLYLYPCQYGEFDILYRNKLEIRMDTNMEIAIENIKVRLDSIPNFVKTHILNFGKDPNYSTKPQSALIEISLDNKLVVGDMEPILDKVIEGYRNTLLFYLDQSKRNIEDLSEEEIKKVKEEIPFNIWIESQQLKLPPPKEPRKNKLTHPNSGS